MVAVDAEYLELTFGEVIAAVKSLYADRIRPFGRVVMQRIRERAAARAEKAAKEQGYLIVVDVEAMPRINPRRLRKMCEACRQLSVQPESGPEFSATLVGRPDQFVDACSPEDLNPPELWQDFAVYLEGLCPEEMQLPAGRYACARMLMDRQLPFFAGYSLGHICHVVQLSITQRRLLGYRDRWLMPYMYSNAWVKEQCALAHYPMGNECAQPVASWDAVRVGLQCLLDQAQRQPFGISSSNVRLLFRSCFQLELSVTALGHVTLLDVMRDPRLHDVCSLHAERTGQYLVKQATRPESEEWPCFEEKYGAISMMQMPSATEQAAAVYAAPEPGVEDQVGPAPECLPSCSKWPGRRGGG